MLRRIILLIALVLAFGVMAGDFFVLRGYSGVALVERAPLAEDSRADAGLWGYALRRAVRLSGSTGMQHPVFFDRVLAAGLSHYPLDASAWLDRGRLARRHPEQSALLEDHLNTAAALQPGNRALRWRAAMLAAQSGRLEAAEAHLRQWLDDHPNDAGRALFVAGRWLNDPDVLIDRIVPPQPEFLTGALDHARRYGNTALAEALWARMDAPDGPDDVALHARVDLLLQDGRGTDAARLWAAADPHYLHGGVPNGHFEREFGPARGLNWRLGSGDGVKLGRSLEEFHSEPGSLELAFDGSENVRLSAWVWIPVEPGRRYRLAGWWRADKLTTRALPRLRVWSPGNGTLEVVELPSDTFAWQPWSVEWVAPEDTEVVRLYVERRPTDAFDRFISGRLWLDSITLEALEAAVTLTETDTNAPE